jgi:hypothetical protein
MARCRKQALALIDLVGDAKWRRGIEPRASSLGSWRHSGGGPSWINHLPGGLHHNKRGRGLVVGSHCALNCALDPWLA